MAEYWFLADWLPYSLDLNLLDFAYWRILQAKVQATPHTNLIALCLSVASEFNLQAVVYIHKACRSFCCRHDAVAKKNEFQMEWIISQQPSKHQPILFRSRESFKHRKKSILVHGSPPHPVNISSYVLTDW
jgi:hypothetical protein